MCRQIGKNKVYRENIIRPGSSGIPGKSFPEKKAGINFPGKLAGLYREAFPAKPSIVLTGKSLVNTGKIPRTKGFLQGFYLVIVFPWIVTYTYYLTRGTS